MNDKAKTFALYDIVHDNEEEILESINKKYEEYFSVAFELLECGLHIFPIGKSLKNEVSANVQRTLLSLYTKSFRVYRSILILCKSGLGYEALIQTRSLLDTCSYIFYIAEKDHDERWLHYIHSLALSWERAVSDLADVFPERKEELNIEWYEKRYADALKYFRDRHGKDKDPKEIRSKYALKPETAAQALKDVLPKQYKTFFKYASFIAHGQDVLEYIYPIEKNKFLLKATPLEDWVLPCIKNTMGLFLIIMDRVNDILKLGEDDSIKKVHEELIKLLKQ